jgi:hypothetical protein
VAAAALHSAGALQLVLAPWRAASRQKLHRILCVSSQRHGEGPCRVSSPIEKPDLWSWHMLQIRERLQLPSMPSIGGGSSGTR